MDEPEPLLHLVRGSDAFLRTRKMLDDFSAELNKWAKLSQNTDFAEALAKQ
ncbi:MAG: hypothetical protein K2X81_12385 [Candidatus Obscuribacterales bacterium]|nr:hypothetical protein [Candidatus Obscuribacterales bacterium]